MSALCPKTISACFDARCTERCLLDRAMNDEPRQQRSFDSAPSLSGAPTEIEALVAAIDALEQKATPGEWETVPVMLAGTDGQTPWGESSGRLINGPPQTIESDTFSKRWFTNKYDAQLIVALRNAWPQLRDALQTAQKPNTPNDAVREALAELVRLNDLTKGVSDPSEVYDILEANQRAVNAAWSRARALLEETK